MTPKPPRPESMLVDVRSVAHLHVDPELPEEEERPHADPAWRTRYPCTQPSVHPSTWWISWVDKAGLHGRQKVLDIGGGNGVLAAHHWGVGNVTVLTPAAERIGGGARSFCARERWTFPSWTRRGIPSSPP